jgi:hypothetical protein
MPEQKISRPHSGHKAVVVAVAKRQYSDPIPDEFLPLFVADGLRVDDDDHNVIAYRAGKKVGAVWGPGVEGHWFAYRDGSDAARVADRDAGLRHMLGLGTDAVASRG